MFLRRRGKRRLKAETGPPPYWLTGQRGRVVRHGEVRGRMNAGTRARGWPRGIEGREKERIDRERESTLCKEKRYTVVERKEEKRWRGVRTRNSNAQCARTTLPPGPTNGPNHHHHHHHRSPPSPPAREPHFDSYRHLSPSFCISSCFVFPSLPLFCLHRCGRRRYVAVFARPRVCADPFKLQILRNRSFTFPFTFPHDGFHERRRGDSATKGQLKREDREEVVTFLLSWGNGRGGRGGRGLLWAFVVEDYGDGISYRIRYFLLVPYHARRIE